MLAEKLIFSVPVSKILKNAEKYCTHISNIIAYLYSFLERELCLVYKHTWWSTELLYCYTKMPASLSKYAPSCEALKGPTRGFS